MGAQATASPHGSRVITPHSSTNTDQAQRRPVHGYSHLHYVNLSSDESATPTIQGNCNQWYQACQLAIIPAHNAAAKHGSLKPNLTTRRHHGWSVPLAPLHPTPHGLGIATPGQTVPGLPTAELAPISQVYSRYCWPAERLPLTRHCCRPTSQCSTTSRLAALVRIMPVFSLLG